jgi:uncharacterized protein Veg
MLHATGFLFNCVSPNNVKGFGTIPRRKLGETVKLEGEYGRQSHEERSNLVDFSRIIPSLRKHDIFYLFIFTYVIYNLNMRPIGSGDTLPATLLPFSILFNHNLYLDQFSNYLIETYSPYFIVEVEGHYLSSYPIVTPVLITPIYIILYILLNFLHYPIDLSVPGFAIIVYAMGKLSASLIASLSVVFIFLSIKELSDRKIALICALIYAFATNTWTISSQSLWQHGMGELLLSMMIYIVIKNEILSRNRNLAYLGILSGLFVFNRPVDGVILLSFFIYILGFGWRSAYYFGSTIFSSLPFLIYNLYYFGSIFGGYAAQISIFCISSESVVRFAGLLISPSRGLFIYTPVLLLSILGYLKVNNLKNSRLRLFFETSGVSVLCLVIVYSFFSAWWAGWSYGPRFLTDTLPILTIFLGFYLKDRPPITLSNKRENLKVIIISTLLLWSILVQIIGAFYYPSGNWDAEPNIEERLWYWNETQISRSLDAGMFPIDNPINYISNILQHILLSDDVSGENPLEMGRQTSTAGAASIESDALLRRVRKRP